MTARCFLDTNILVYADDRDAGERREVARSLLRRVLPERGTSLSTQVLQEYFAAVTRKLGIPAEAARRRVAALGRLDVVSPDATDVLAAIDLHRLHTVSIWDALIVRAAQIAGAQVLYTEDLQNGRQFESLRVVNPFL